MKKIALLFLILPLLCQAQEDTYKATLIQFVKAQGADASYETSIDQMVSMFGLSEEFSATFKENSLDELITLLVPVYKKHFTETELKEAVALFDTPIGRKIAQKNPLIAAESMEISMQWGMKLAEGLQKQLFE